LDARRIIFVPLIELAETDRMTTRFVSCCCKRGKKTASFFIELDRTKVKKTNMEKNKTQQDRPNRDQETEKKPAQGSQTGQQPRQGQEGQQRNQDQQDRERKQA
jgi:hypothetical protein